MTVTAVALAVALAMGLGTLGVSASDDAAGRVRIDTSGYIESESAEIHARRTLPATRAVTPSTAPTVDTAEDAGSATVPSSIVPGSVNRSSLRLEARYDAALTLGWTSRAVRVDSTATIRNTSGGSIDRVELNTVAARLGGLRLLGVTVDGATVTATIHDQTIIVPLGGILPEGETTVVRVRYAATLRSTTGNSDWLFTKANSIADLYRWLPWVSRRVAFVRPNLGDPFVTPSSPRVRVRITTDRPLVLATSGNRTASNGLTQTYEATNVRDFTITAAPDFRTRSALVGTRNVIVYYRPGQDGAAILRSAVSSLSKLQKLLGAYPYRTYRVAQSAGGLGMESPALVWIPYGLAPSRLPYLVGHETAHQWFYALVGNDQAKEPFTDEAAADFVTRYMLGSKRGSRCATDELDRSIYGYSRSCYYETIYIQGGNLLDTARRQMGSTAFWTALRGYLTDHRFGLASTKQLLQALDAATTKDLSTTFAPRFPRIY